MENDDNKPDLTRLINLIQNYTDYQNSLVLTPEDVSKILDADSFDHDNYTHNPAKKEPIKTEKHEPKVYVIEIPGNIIDE